MTIKNKFHLLGWLAIVLLLSLITACGGGTENPGKSTITSFTASPDTITQGQTSTLSWELSGEPATSVSMDNGVAITPGSTSVTVTPAATTTYTLTATNAAGSNTKPVKVTVNSLPVDEAPSRIPGGTLSTNTVMRSGKVYVVEADVIVPEGITLVIEPGAVVKFADCSGSPKCYQAGNNNSDIIVEGNLTANGNSPTPQVITFTSIKDDTVKGDTNEDGGNTTPTFEDWGGIILRNGGTGNFANVEFKYARAGIYTTDSSLTVNTMKIRNSTYAIIASPNDSPDVINLQTTEVEYGGVLVEGGGMSKNVTWGKGGSVVIVNADITVASSATLTIEPGTVVKFRDCSGVPQCYQAGSNNSDVIVEGNLISNGTVDKTITFTSLKDDTIGGPDDNGDGGDTVPVSEDWGEIILRSGGTGNFTNVEFKYARAGIYVTGANLTVNGMKVQKSTYSIIAAPSDSPTVTNLQSTGVSYGGVAVEAGAITKNTSWGKGGATFIVLADVTVASNSTLTIEPGTVVKFRDCSGIPQCYQSGSNNSDIIVEGNLVVAGPTTFTSLKDDTLGGDSNGDLGETTPADGDWGTLLFSPGATSTIGVSVEVKYASEDPIYP